MINNTALQRWHRAAARHLDAQFMNAIIHGMNCSPFEAEAIRDTVHTVYAPLMETTDTLKPGQLRLSVIAASVAPNTPLAQAQQCLVTLTLEALADLFNCGVRTLVDDLAALRQADATPPLRSTVKDMGRAVTHRRQIVERWLAGQEYTDIARATYHSVASVANYVDKFKRVATLQAAEFTPDTIAVIARLSPALVQALLHLVQEAQPVPHRREALDALTKKNSPWTPNART